MLRASASWRSRLCFAAVGLALLCGLWGPPVNDSRAAQKDKKSDEPAVAPERKSLQTKDRGAIHITYYRSNAGKNSPVVVLLHMSDGNRLLWEGTNGFAELLQHEDFAVVTVDLRHHGESKAGGATAGGNANQGHDKKKAGKVAAGPELKPADYKAMVEYDMAAVKNFIYEEHQAGNLNMNKLGIVGPEMGASVAFEYAAVDWNKSPHNDGQPGFQTPRGQDVRALVLISPQTSFQGLKISKIVKELRDPRRGIAFLVCFSKDDPDDKGQAQVIFDQLKVRAEDDKRMYKYDFDGKLRGTQLLGSRGGKFEQTMLAFFNEHLKKLDSPWRDRESKLERLGKKK
ncbi:MAG: alpha/beta fold hydrolase [Planctomycetaceae bacterium]|nr:alpha/beta fold hydrolase [Planctomycetaceae bacterium]